LRFGLLLAQSYLAAKQADEQKQRCPDHPKHEVQGTKMVKLSSTHLFSGWFGPIIPKTVDDP
jgi:hypothetical protein